MAAFYSFTPDYWQRAKAARSYAMDVLHELRGMPGGFSIAPSFLDGVDAPNGNFQYRITAHLDDLNAAELRLIGRALGSNAPAILPQEQPWQAVRNLEGIVDQAAGWIARLIKQAGGVPNGV